MLPFHEMVQHKLVEPSEYSVPSALFHFANFSDFVKHNLAQVHCVRLQCPLNNDSSCYTHCQLYYIANKLKFGRAPFVPCNGLSIFVSGHWLIPDSASLAWSWVHPLLPLF